MLLEGGVGVSEKPQRQVHAIRTHPRRLRMPEGLTQTHRYAADLLPRRLVDVHSNEQPLTPGSRRYSVTHRLTMSSAACDA